MRVVVGTTLDNFWPDKNTKPSTNFYFDIVSFTCHSGSRSQRWTREGKGRLDRGSGSGSGCGSNIGPGDLGSWLKIHWHANVCCAPVVVICPICSPLPCPSHCVPSPLLPPAIVLFSTLL